MPEVKKMKVVHLKELLAAAAGVTGSPGKHFLEKALLDTGAISVLVDGVDELCPVYTEKVLRLLELLLHETKVALLWVSTRPEISRSLGRTLRCSHVSLKPLTYEEQVQYLQTYWTSKHDKELDTEGMAKKLVDALPRSTSPEDSDDADDFDSDASAENHLLAVPLHLRMAAEIFSAKMNREEDKLVLLGNSKINIFDLYRQFIDLKQKEYRNKHFEGANFENHPFDNTKFSLLHQNCAMLQLVEDKEFEGMDGHMFKESIQENQITLRREKTGILWMEEDGSLRFAHYSFLEFFAASWLSHNLFSAAASEVVFSLYERGVRRGVRHFLEWMLADGCPLHCAVLAGEKSVERLLKGHAPVDEVDRGGRAALHLAAVYHERRVAQELVAAGCQLDPRDRLLGWTPLQYLETVLNGHPRGDGGPVASAGEAPRRSTADVEIWDALFVTEQLLSAGAEKTPLAALSHDQQRVIEAATDLQLPHVMDLLLEHGITVSNYMLALHLAEVGNKLELLQRLLKYQLDNSRNDGFLKATKNEDSPEHLQGAAEVSPSPCDSETAHSLVLKIHDPEDESDAFLEFISEQEKDGSNLEKLASAYEGNIELLKFLVKNAADANAKNKRDITALHFAAYKGHQECVRYLISQGSSVNAADGDGFTPLHLSAKQGHLKVVENLISSGANVKAKSKEGVTALHLAALYRHRDCVRYFRQIVNEPEMNGYTPLHVAVNEGCLQTVESLLQHGADCNGKAKSGVTAFHLAVLRGDMQCLELLLDRKRGERKSINEPDNYGLSPLHLASGKGYIQILRQLLNVGGRVNSQTEKGGTSLHFAIMSGREKCVECIIQQNAELSQKYIEGLTPVQLAMRLRLPNVIAKLLNAGVDPNEKNQQGEALLYLAALQGDKESVEALLKKGANPDEQNYDKSTSLHVSAKKGYIEVVRLLLQFGASPNKNDVHGHTPLVIAASEGHQECVHTLRRAEQRQRRNATVFFKITKAESVKNTETEPNDEIESQSSSENDHKSVSQLLTLFEYRSSYEIQRPSMRIEKIPTENRLRVGEVSKVESSPQEISRKDVGGQDKSYNSNREYPYKSNVSQLRERFENPPGSSPKVFAKYSAAPFSERRYGQSPRSASEGFLGGGGGDHYSISKIRKEYGNMMTLPSRGSKAYTEKSWENPSPRDKIPWSSHTLPERVNGHEHRTKNRQGDRKGVEYDYHDVSVGHRLFDTSLQSSGSQMNTVKHSAGNMASPQRSESSYINSVQLLEHLEGESSC